MGKTRERMYVVSTEQWLDSELDKFDIVDTFNSLEQAKLKAQSLVGKFENLLNKSNTDYWLEFGVYNIVVCVKNNKTVVSYAPEFVPVA